VEQGAARTVPDARSARRAQRQERAAPGVRPMIGDPFLNYFALGILFFVVVVLFYGIIAIHDIPHLIAKSRDHPHQDAIHAAGWVSLFTLHALWPFLWIWAMAYRPGRGWGVRSEHPEQAQSSSDDAIAELRARMAEMEARLASPGKVVAWSEQADKSRPRPMQNNLAGDR
jgi:hypothetical protein